MNIKFKRVLSFLSAAAIMLSIAGCSKSDSDSSSDSGSKIKRESIATQPVEETLGNFDLSEVKNDYDIPADYKFYLEAEDGTLSGGASVISKKFLGKFSGSGFVSIFAAGEQVEFDVDFPSEGSYDITLVCATNKEGVSNLITIDGAALTSFKIEAKKFDKAVAEKVLIPKGKHKMAIKGDEGLAFIDSITITPAKAIDMSQYEVSKQLCNPNASDETKRLYNFLTDIYGKYTLSGQYASNNEGKECREFVEIERNTGKRPAILGLDFMELSPSRVAHGAGGGQMVAVQAMDWWKNDGGIVTICWHWNAPEPYLNVEGQPWWKGFNKEATTFDLAAALDGTDPDGYNYLIRDIDAIAEELAKLDDNHVPILWRPLHEGGGDPKWKNPWFWWGSSGADAYKKLWVLMYDRLTNYHKINNLIWVWNGQEPSYYPGDEYVDILGYDIYPEQKHDSSSQKDTFKFTQSVTDTKKIVAMTENGQLFDPDAAFNDGSRWAWFSTWNGEFTLKDAQLSGEYSTLEMWKKVYNSKRVLTVDELPDLKNYPLDTEKYLAQQNSK